MNKNNSKRKRRFGILDNDLFFFTNSIDIIKRCPSTLKLSLIKRMVVSNFFINEYVIKQNEYIDSFYFIKNGSFEINYNRISEANVGINIEYFIEYQNFIKEHFSNNRKYEIDGKLKVNDKNKIFISQKGEMFGDIEWYLNTNKSLFNVVCIEAKGEIAIISRIDIENILRNFVYNIKSEVRIKLDYIRNLLVNNSKIKKKRFINKVTLMKNDVGNVFDVYNKLILNKYKKEHSNKLHLRINSDSLFKTQITKEKTQRKFSEIFSVKNKSKEKHKLINKKKLTILTERLSSISKEKNNISKNKKNKNESNSIGDILYDLYNVNKKPTNKNLIKLKKTKLKKSNSDTYIPFKTSTKILNIKKKQLNDKLSFHYFMSKKGEEKLIFPDFMKDDNNYSKNNNMNSMNSINSSRFENSNSFNSIPLDKNFFCSKYSFNSLLKKKYRAIRCNSAQKILKIN